MPCPKNIVWIEWNFIKKNIFKKDQVACNHYNFEYIAQLNKLKIHLKKWQLFIHIQSSQNRRLSISYQLTIISHYIIPNKKMSLILHIASHY